MSYAPPSNVDLDNELVEDDFIVADDEAVRDNGPPPAYNIPPPAEHTSAAGEQFEQRRFMGGDTLDEPVYATLFRDMRAVATKLRQTLWIYPEDSENNDWDLWGPLVFCLLYSLAMCFTAPENQASDVFSGVFSLIWIGEAIITLNIKLLGGTISFFHALCVTGYSLFPLVISAVISTFVKKFFVRLPIALILVGWAIYSAANGLRHSGVLESRVLLAMYPVALYFVGLGWLCIITS